MYPLGVVVPLSTSMYAHLKNNTRVCPDALRYSTYAT